VNPVRERKNLNLVGSTLSLGFCAHIQLPRFYIFCSWTETPSSLHPRSELSCLYQPRPSYFSVAKTMPMALQNPAQARTDREEARFADLQISTLVLIRFLVLVLRFLFRQWKRGLIIASPNNAWIVSLLCVYVGLGHFEQYYFFSPPSSSACHMTIPPNHFPIAFEKRLYRFVYCEESEALPPKSSVRDVESGGGGAHVHMRHNSTS